MAQKLCAVEFTYKIDPGLRNAKLSGFSVAAVLRLDTAFYCGVFYCCQK